MKKGLFILVIILFSSLVLAYEPPVYIANPKTSECQYYFAGDAAHFNPRPRGFDITLGLTSNFENLEQACNIFKFVKSACESTGGTISEEGCICPKDSNWDSEAGCVKQKSLDVNLSADSNFTPVENVSRKSVNWDRIVLFFIILVIIIFFSIYLKKRGLNVKKKKNNSSNT